MVTAFFSSALNHALLAASRSSLGKIITTQVSAIILLAKACSALPPSTPGLPEGMLISNKRWLANNEIDCP